MRKHINLLFTKKDDSQLTKKIHSIINKILMLNFFLFFIVLILYFIFEKKQNEYKNLLITKEKLIEKINKSIKNEVRSSYIINKTRFLNQEIIKDIHIKPYLTLVNDQLKYVSPEARIKDLSFNNKRNFKFSIIFQNQDSLIDFIDFIEKDEFRKKFNNLFINSLKIEIGSDLDTNKSINLIIEGQFKKIKNEDFY